jgi:glycosyltransferase involved in cell wall biosynthesis
MTTEPLVSIIINNYNYDRFIAEAIDSALNQTYAAIEVIVVDDCSTDNSRQIIGSYGDRIIPVLHEVNGKQGAAFNSGFAKSQGDIIIFLDSDDCLYPQAVERIVAVWKPGISKVHYRLNVVNATGEPRGFSYPPVTQPLAQGEVWKTVLEQGSYNGVATSGNALSREALSNVMPIAPEYATTSDDYLSVLIPLFGDVVAVEEPLGLYRLHDSNQWAMTSIASSRFHRFIRHDLQRCDLIQEWGTKLGYQVPKDLYMRSFGRVWSRLSSLRLDPTNHPVQSDHPLVLMYLGIKALWQYSDYNWQKRLMYSLWFVGVGILPRSLAEIGITWLFVPQKRPKLWSGFGRKPVATST